MSDIEGVAAAVAAAQPEEPPTAQKPTVENPEGVNKFQHAIASWRNFDLTALTSALDTTASDIVSYQRDSTVQRKDLAQKTKDFRKMDDATKLAEVKGLLKAYQSFIDLLTNHSKSVNSSFLQVYTTLSEVPDPYPLLEASVDSMLVAEETFPQLSEENRHLQENVAKLTTQLEDTEARLQSERAGRKELEDSLERQVQEVQSSWTAVLDEKTDNWTAREKTLEEKAENQERLLNEMRASYEVNQRLGKGGPDSDAQQGVSSAELEMLSSELERTSSRLAEVEARNEQLRVELAQSKSSASVHQQTPLEDDPGYMRVRSENSSLIRKLEAARLARESLQRDLDSRLHSMERETAMLKEEKETLKTKIQKWSDYDEVKQELEVLKSIEFAMGENDDDNNETKDDPEESGGKGDTLEKMLLLRNKKLGDELTVLRVSRQDLQSRLKGLQEDLSRTTADLEQSKNLNEKLEADLETLQSEGANAFPSGASVAGTYVTRAETRRGGGRISPTSSIISGMDPRGGGREVYGGGSGMLPMVTAQKDRYKKKNAELEKELSESHRAISQLRMEVGALQKDNLNLYEKTRYVSTYNRGGSGTTASTSSAYASNPNPSSVQIGGGSASPGAEMSRYRQAYESNLSPFAAFRGKESARAYRRMSLPEKAVYSVTRMVLASRTSRNLFAAYCVALHVFVFLCLYWLGSADSAQAAGQLGRSVTAAAAGAGSAAGRGKVAREGG